MDETGAADIDCPREEGHAEGLLVGDALKGTDEIGAFEILECGLAQMRWIRITWGPYLGFVGPLVA